MKKTFIPFVAFAGVLILSTAPSFAATLTNGGLGQVVSDPQNFGVAVCNNGTAALSKAVPITVAVNDQSTTVSSAVSIAAGHCEYTYISYTKLGMQGGQTYSVNVTIDPAHSVIANSDNTTTYDVTVPPQTVAIVPANENLLATVSFQIVNPLILLWNWLGDLYRAL